MNRRDFFAGVTGLIVMPKCLSRPTIVEEGLTSEEMAKLVFESDGNISFYGKHYVFGTAYKLTGDVESVDIRDFDKFPIVGSFAGSGLRGGDMNLKWLRGTKVFRNRGVFALATVTDIDGYDLDEPGLNLILFHEAHASAESYVRTGTKTHPWRKV